MSPLPATSVATLALTWAYAVAPPGSSGDTSVGQPLPLEHPWLALAAVVAGLLLLYVAATIWWPFVECPHPRCERGKRRSPSGKAWRPCWWCKGRGSRLRWGRRLYEAMSGNRKHTGS